MHFCLCSSLLSAPPESIIILDSKGATIKDHTLGPYNEGSSVNVTCVAIGGKLILTCLTYSPPSVRLSFVNEQHDAKLEEEEEEKEEEKDCRSILPSVDAAFRV